MRLNAKWFYVKPRGRVAGHASASPGEEAPPVRVEHLTDPSKLYIFPDYISAIQFARGQGHVLRETPRCITYSDFPRVSGRSHLEIPPIPLHLLLSRRG